MHIVTGEKGRSPKYKPKFSLCSSWIKTRRFKVFCTYFVPSLFLHPFHQFVPFKTPNATGMPWTHLLAPQLLAVLGDICRPSLFADKWEFGFQAWPCLPKTLRFSTVYFFKTFLGFFLRHWSFCGFVMLLFMFLIAISIIPGAYFIETSIVISHSNSLITLIGNEDSLHGNVRKKASSACPKLR